ncbi:BARD1 [Symbiodinium sp. KB8]|nr:BARD1 [Symbiodinium sp. KB8]
MSQARDERSKSKEETLAQERVERLLIASRSGQVPSVQLLLEERVDPNASLGIACGALQQAAAHGQTEVANLLIQAAADVHLAEDDDHSTPLHLAAEFGHVEVVRLLLQAGAPPEELDTFGRSPADKATECGHAEVARMLQEVVSESCHAEGTQSIRWSVSAIVRLRRKEQQPMLDLAEALHEEQRAAMAERAEELQRRRREAEERRRLEEERRREEEERERRRREEEEEEERRREQEEADRLQREEHERAPGPWSSQRPQAELARSPPPEQRMERLRRDKQAQGPVPAAEPSGGVGGLLAPGVRAQASRRAADRRGVPPAQWGSRGAELPSGACYMLEDRCEAAQAREMEAKFRRQQELAAQRARLDKDAQLRARHNVTRSMDLPLLRQERRKKEEARRLEEEQRKAEERRREEEERLRAEQQRLEDVVHPQDSWGRQESKRACGTREQEMQAGSAGRGAQTVRFDDVSISAFTPFNDSQGSFSLSMLSQPFTELVFDRRNLRRPEGKQTTFVEDQEDDSELEARAWSSMKSPLPKEPGVPYPPDRSIHEWHLQRIVCATIWRELPNFLRCAVSETAPEMLERVEHLRGKQVVGDEAFSCRAPDLLRVHGTRQAQLRQEELRRKEQELVESKLTVHDIGYRGCNFLPVQMLKLYSINLTYHVQPRGLFCLQRRAKKEDEQRRREEEQEAQRRLEEEALRPCKAKPGPARRALADDAFDLLRGSEDSDEEDQEAKGKAGRSSKAKGTKKTPSHVDNAFAFLAGACEDDGSEDDGEEAWEANYEQDSTQQFQTSLRRYTALSLFL